MNQLKKKIIVTFLIIAMVLSFAESIIDSIFDDYLFLVVPNHTVSMKLIFALYIFLSIALFLLAAAYFYRVVSKEIEEETKRQMEEKSQLFANITHDLKTPITSILGFAKACKDHKVEEDHLDEVHGIIYEKAKRTDELINLLFGYSKLEAGSYEFHFEELNVCTLIRNIVAEMYSEFEQKGILVEIEIPEATYHCRIDLVEFSRAIHNLLVNAYKHNEKGTHVLIQVCEMNGEVKISVADTGVKIEKQFVDSIFEPFVCGDESRTGKSGNGLGLAIAKKVIAKHGGSLTLTQEIENYTKAFVIILNLVEH